VERESMLENPHENPVSIDEGLAAPTAVVETAQERCQGHGGNRADALLATLLEGLRRLREDTPEGVRDSRKLLDVYQAMGEGNMDALLEWLRDLRKEPPEREKQCREILKQVWAMAQNLKVRPNTRPSRPGSRGV
jgi:hypothetical protein